MSVKAHRLINQDSGDFEYYTPPEIIVAAKKLLGRFDLDPASSEKANECIDATRIYTAADDGLSQSWHGLVWMNHPFSRSGNAKWVNKLVSEYKAGNVTGACCITFAATSEAWFKPLMEFPQCFLGPRTNYYLPDGTKKRGVTKGSVVTYLLPESEIDPVGNMQKAFAGLGIVKW